MKKLLLILVIGFAGLPVVFGQVTLLPKVGFNVSNVRFDNGDFRFYGDAQARAGLVLGMGANVPFNDPISFQAELLYISKGFTVDETTNEGYYSLNYLEVPLLAKATFGNRDLSFYGNGGLSLGFLLGGRVKGDWNVFGLEGEYDERVEFENHGALPHEVDANRIDIGFNLGGGVNFDAGGFPVFVDLRYNAGLIDYDQEHEPSKNRSFAITFGTYLSR